IDAARRLDQRFVEEAAGALVVLPRQIALRLLDEQLALFILIGQHRRCGSRQSEEGGYSGSQQAARHAAASFLSDFVDVLRDPVAVPVYWTMTSVMSSSTGLSPPNVLTSS